MKGDIFIIVVGSILLALVWVVWVIYEHAVLSGSDAPLGPEYVCTADAMQCPDGSWVGRTGPKCEFVCPR